VRFSVQKEFQTQFKKTEGVAQITNDKERDRSQFSFQTSSLVATPKISEFSVSKKERSLRSARRFFTKIVSPVSFSVLLNKRTIRVTEPPVRIIELPLLPDITPEPEVGFVRKMHSGAVWPV
jgi:hypothetical protein